MIDLAVNCHGWWKMNDNADDSIVADASPKNNQGTLYGTGPSEEHWNWTSSRHADSGNPPYLNGALDIDTGRSNYIQAGTMGNFGSSMDELTITGWIGEWGSGDDPDLSLFGATGPTSQLLRVYFNKNLAAEQALGYIGGMLRDQDGSMLHFNTQADTGITDGNPHFICIVFKKSSGVGEIWVDGVKKDVSYLHEGTGTNFANFTGNFGLGNFAGASDAVDGVLDMMGLFDKALSETEIDHLWNNGVGIEELAWTVPTVTRVGFISDLHFCDQDDLTDWSAAGSPPEYRRFSTAVERFWQFISICNLHRVHIAVQEGDVVDWLTTDTEKRTKMQAMITQSGYLLAPFANIPGNHESTGWTGEGDKPTPANYYTDISGNQITMENVYTDGDGWKSYTFDVRDIRFLVLFAPMGNVANGHLSWLEDRLAETNRPVIVLAHCGLWYPPSGYAGGWSYCPNYEAVQAILEGGNVQAVICGHYHWNARDTVINDIPYYSLYGSVLCPSAADNAYFIFEIIPNAIQTANGMKANVKITGYGSNGTSKTKDFERYLVGV